MTNEYKIKKTDPRLALRGVRIKGRQWEVSRQVAGKLCIAMMPIESTAAALIAEWEQLKTAAPKAAEAGTLPAAIATFKLQITAMPSYGATARELDRWVAELDAADRDPASITADDIAIVLNRWKIPVARPAGLKGRWAPVPDPGSTVIKRLSALSRFYSVMFPALPNPIDALGDRRPKAKGAEVRGVPIDVLVRIIAAMPDTFGRSRKPGARLSLAKIRATAMAYTGLDPIQLKELKPNDVILGPDAGTVRSYRRKGDGVVIDTIPLTGPGLAAMRAFVAADAFGTFNTTVVYRAVVLAAAKAGIPRGTFRTKDLRHSFGSHLYTVCGDQATVGRFLFHAPGSKMTARYTRSANRVVNEAAAAAFVLPAE